jgi:hypothetical protein
MSPTRRRKPVSRRTQRNRSVPARDFWGASAGEDTPLPVIRPSDHPTALVHSLGAPPFPGGAVATHYFDAVYERAAALALALAAAADLLEVADDEETDVEIPTSA